MLFLAAGCATNPSGAQSLREGYAALNDRQYEQAIGAADQFLAATPEGAGAAEATFLRGRAIYQRDKATPAKSVADVAEARVCFEKALTLAPPPNLEALAHSDLANAAYFQDDFVTAEKEWSAAYDKLENPDAKSWVMYRAGLCRQRQGRWADADAMFASVQQTYPSSEPARRAREHQGHKAFFVQVGAFQDLVSADRVIAALTKTGVKAQRGGATPQKLQPVYAGPRATYREAMALKQQLTAQYPSAVIVP